MEGSHETALMVAAYQKGIRKDGEAIYEAVLKNVTETGIDHPCGGSCGNPLLDVYIKQGYMPMEKGVVSKTLDYAYDDWCVSQLALALGKKKEGKGASKKDVNHYLRKQAKEAKEPINTAFAEAFSKIQL